uniref:poly(ADP-ribose) glycohydrolase n=1 Tax=Daucus carota subsp. sativus TaxID=79200 RepID=A0A166BS39_DAUCS
MENREEVKSIIRYLPVFLRSSNIFWPPPVVEALKSLSGGPNCSNVDSGELLFLAISDMRNSLSLSADPLSPSAPHGISLFFDDELVGALLACSLLCLFPVAIRGAKRLPTINFDQLFASSIATEFFCHLLSDAWSLEKIYCFPLPISGLIEDQTEEALEVDFANKYIGGGVLHKGCLQEEIRFVINPELILGMLFLPAMAKNEAIEIVGAERFSNYTGYASSFRFSGNYMDKRDVDMSGRRKTRITAIDAKSNPGYRQYKVEYIMREINKAYCGFIDQSYIQDIRPPSCTPEDVYMETSSTSSGDNKILSIDKLNKDFERKGDQCMGQHDSIGIATGNWGCGAFGGDPELKTIIQWLAASQASRPFISYYTFGIDKLQSLDQVTRWIMSQKWTVGDLWNMLIEYSSQKLQRETKVGFCSWLLPSLHAHDPMDLY